MPEHPNPKAQQAAKLLGDAAAKIAQARVLAEEIFHNHELDTADFASLYAHSRAAAQELLHTAAALGHARAPEIAGPAPSRGEGMSALEHIWKRLWDAKLLSWQEGDVFKAATEKLAEPACPPEVLPEPPPYRVYLGDELTEGDLEIVHGSLMVDIEACHHGIEYCARRDSPLTKANWESRLAQIVETSAKIDARREPKS